MSKIKQFSNNNVPLTPPIFYIMLSLANKERHGYDIMKQVESDSQGKIKLGPGTLYGAIKRMLEEKLIIEIVSVNARRKYYKLTEKGSSMFSSELQRYNEAIAFAKKKNLFAKFNIAENALAYA
jgi:DNA-binding PadR family transcriptional regulator